MPLKRPGAVQVEREYLAALEFEAFARKSRGTLQRQREVREILDRFEPVTDPEGYDE